ncbi:hypothetical protein ABFX02_03G002900 [Erythranthe guttata]
MAETEVSTEVSNVVGIEEKCLSEMSSCKDLPKPDSNGTSDLENSYVFVSGDDGLSDDTVGDKDAGGEGLSILPESKAVTVEEGGEKLDAGNEKLDPENAKLDHESEKPYSEKLDPESEKLDPESEKLDTVSTEVSEPLNERENGNVELRNGDLTVVNVSTSKLESSLEQGDGGEVSLADSVEDNIGETEIVVEAEVEVVKDPDGEIAEAVVDQNVVASDSRDVSVEANDEVKLEREVVKTLEVEVPTSTFLDLDLKTCPIKNEEETLMEISRENVELNIVSSNTNDSGNANDECADQINLSVTEASEASRGSKDVVVNVADCDLQDVSKETNDEIKSEREVVETAAHEIPASTSSDLELEPHPINNKEEKVEEEATTTLSSSVLQSQQCDTLDNNVPGILEPTDEAKTSPINTDGHVETVGDLVLEEKGKEDFSVCHVNVDNGVQYHEEPEIHLDGSEVSGATSLSETKTEAFAPTQSFPTSNDYEPEIENVISDAETIGAVSSSLADGPKSEEVEEALPVHDSSMRSYSKEASLGSDSTLDTAVLAEKEPTSQLGEPHAETRVSSEKAKAADSPPETFDVKSCSPPENFDVKSCSPPETLDVKSKPGDHVHNVSTISSVETNGSVTLACRTEVSDKFDVEEGAANIVSDKRDVEDMVDQLDGAVGNSNDNLSLQENEESENSSSNNISVASIGGSSIDGEAAIIKTKPKPFNFLVRVPRFDDESLREQIRLAKLHVDEKTKLREAVQVQIQEKRANTQIHGIDYEYAKGEARSARKLVRSKRVEIDSLQAVINKAKNALSIEDIDSQMYNMERMIQHETLPLKEEKQLIREIKQLKQIREQLSSNIGSQDEINQALEQREEVEERLKILRKELDVLKGRVLKSEAVATEAEKKYDDENKKVRELQTQFRAANDVRQEAYAQWQDLRKELSEKTKHFFKYKDSAALANNYAFTRDREALYRLCFNNVENFMELWNTSEEFRTDYVKFNARSYVRRFGTLDGRALGPDEEPPILPSYVNDRVKMVPTPVKVDVLTSQTPTLELKQEPMVENVTSEVKTVKKMTELKNQEVTNKGLALHIHSNGLDTVSVKEIPDEVQEEPKKSKEEIESIRKVEERRKEEVEAKLKEERRLEALAKANEARERKKRQAEKLQMRAELKTQKEAELKEKEREKRQRKKERKKAASDVNDIDTAPSSETASVISIDTEAKDTTTTTTSSSAVPKKAQKSWLFAKQSKAKSVVPPALRNRNKKRLQQWMWVGVTSLVILLLFWLGNIGVFSSIHYKRRSPVI